MIGVSESMRKLKRLKHFSSYIGRVSREVEALSLRAVLGNKAAPVTPNSLGSAPPLAVSLYQNVLVAVLLP